MEEVPFIVPKEDFLYKPFIPEVVRAIEQPKAPPLLIDEASGAPKQSCASYTVRDMDCRAFLRIICGDNYDQQVPLAMCHYLKPAQDKLFDEAVCRQCDIENVSRQTHNKFVVDLLSAFMKLNDVGTSGGRLTTPQAPVDCYQERQREIEALFKDKLAITEKAIEYLGSRGVYCSKDYKFADAVERANEEKFREIVEAKRASGKVRVTLEGRPPCWWDGVSERDPYGRKLKFEAGKQHTFLTPSVRVVLQDEMQLASDPLLLPAPLSAPQQAITDAAETQPNKSSFDDLPKSGGVLLLQ